MSQAHANNLTSNSTIQAAYNSTASLDCEVATSDGSEAINFVRAEVTFTRFSGDECWVLDPYYATNTSLELFSNNISLSTGNNVFAIYVTAMDNRTVVQHELYVFRNYSQPCPNISDVDQTGNYSFSDLNNSKVLTNSSNISNTVSNASFSSDDSAVSVRNTSNISSHSSNQGTTNDANSSALFYISPLQITLLPCATVYSNTGSVTGSGSGSGEIDFDLLFAPLFLNLDEGEYSNFSISFAEILTSDIVVQFSSHDLVETNPSSLTFTIDSWSVNQTVTVYAKDDLVDREDNYTVEIPILILGREIFRYSVVITDNDDGGG